MGNAILSRSSGMTQHSWHRFAHASPNDFQRVVVAATTRVGGQSVHTITLHLDAHDGSRRASQIDWISKFGERQATNVNGNVVVAGDWNIGPHRRAIANRMDQHGFAFIPQGCGTTVVDDNKCYDHVWRDKSAINGLSATIITGMNRKDSDHFPVRAHLGYK